MCGKHGWHLHCLHRHRHQINMTANIQPPHVLLEGTIKFRDNKKVNINNGTPYFCFFLCNQSNHLCIFVVVILVESTMGCRLQIVARCRFVFFLFFKCHLQIRFKIIPTYFLSEHTFELFTTEMINDSFNSGIHSCFPICMCCLSPASANLSTNLMFFQRDIFFSCSPFLCDWLADKSIRLAKINNSVPHSLSHREAIRKDIVEWKKRRALNTKTRVKVD